MKSLESHSQATFKPLLSRKVTSPLQSKLKSFRRRENMVGVSMVLAEYIKSKQGSNRTMFTPTMSRGRSSFLSQVKSCASHLKHVVYSLFVLSHKVTNHKTPI